MAEQSSTDLNDYVLEKVFTRKDLDAEIEAAERAGAAAARARIKAEIQHRRRIFSGLEGATAQYNAAAVAFEDLLSWIDEAKL